jgi:protein-glucosylgalactosylhydroxylysine glucosidase
MIPKPVTQLLFLIGCSFAVMRCSEESNNHGKIDRYSLVKRNNVILREVDTLGSLSVGNGEFAFTVDASGLQTFPEAYENGISLGTMTQWAWHRDPSSENFSVRDVALEFASCDSSLAPYAIQRNGGRAGIATNVLRANPHRLHLGLVGLVLIKSNGDEVGLNDLQNIHQELELWNGSIESRYEVEGVPVKVTLYAHQEKDQISVHVESPLISMQRLKIRMAFPYGNDCHVCPGYNWTEEDRHQSVLSSVTESSAIVNRQVDSTSFHIKASWKKGLFEKTGVHEFHFTPAKENVSTEFSILFTRDVTTEVEDFASTEKNNHDRWENFWTTGGAIDFSACTDPRAKELERRVVLSQYLTRIQCAGSMPPQETGLTMNSWYGKFHLEMHWWHATHFALWDRIHLMEKSMAWYKTALGKARNTATWQGYRGARWQKMTDPFGNESPSGIGAFIIWQQPHPIYFAELLYRQDSSEQTLNEYRDVVFESAEFMTSFVKRRNGEFHLCRPLIPAQEIFIATETDDPAFELQYWYYGLGIAQQWRSRLGMQEDSSWREARDKLAPLTVHEGLYLPNATTINAYKEGRFRKDHPSVLAAYGLLPWNERIDTTVMARTLEEITGEWNWESTWGWDYPMIAMTAARLNKPELAIDALLMETQKNTYLINGHNYQDKRLRLYLPGNGGVLSAVAMMAAGWDGNTRPNPGFPKNGKWNIRWEGLQRMP